MKRYCGSGDNECETGTSYYYGWLNKMGLDDTKPYERKGIECLGDSCPAANGWQDCVAAASHLPCPTFKLSPCQESFSWLKPHFTFIKQDKEAKYYKVEALFPLVSMNSNLYTEDELIRGARTLKGKPVNINHSRFRPDDVSVRRAEYEDGCVEVLLRVSFKAKYLGQRITDLIDAEQILHVSIEADCEESPWVIGDGEITVGCIGLEFTGLALLTKDVLPGVPLTRIMPVEKLVQSFLPVMQGDEKELERNESVVAADGVQAVVKKTPCAHEVRIAELRLELSEKKRELSGLQEKLKIADAKLKTKEADLRAKDEEMATLKKESAAKIVTVEEGAALKLRAKDAELKAKDDEVTAVKARLEGRITEVEAAVQAKAESMEAAENEVSEAGKRAVDAETRLSEMRSNFGDVSDRLEKKTAELERLRKKFEELVEERDALSSSVGDFETKLNECSEKAFNFAQHNLELTNTLTARNDEIVRLNDKVGELEQALDKAKRHAKQVSRIQVRI